MFCGQCYTDLRSKLRNTPSKNRVTGQTKNPWKPSVSKGFSGRGDRIRTCDFYVPNVALYQAEPHLVMKLSKVLRALPVAVTASCRVRVSLALCDGGHSFLLACSATGSARKRPLAEPHLDFRPCYYNKLYILCQGLSRKKKRSIGDGGLHSARWRDIMMKRNKARLSSRGGEGYDAKKRNGA